MPPESFRGNWISQAALAAALAIGSGASVESPIERDSRKPHVTTPNREKSIELFAIQGEPFDRNVEQIVFGVKQRLERAFGSHKPQPEDAISEDVDTKARRIITTILLETRLEIIDTLRHEEEAGRNKEHYAGSEEAHTLFIRALSTAVSTRVLQSFEEGRSTLFSSPLQREALIDGFHAWLAALDAKSIASYDKGEDVRRHTQETTTVVPGASPEEAPISIRVESPRGSLADSEVNRVMIMNALHGRPREIPAPPGMGLTIPAPWSTEIAS